MPKIVEKNAQKLTSGTSVLGKRPCEDQKQGLLSYLEDNLPVARNQFDGADGYKKLMTKWNEAAELLNAIGPPNTRAKKNGSAWKKYFEDWRIRTKRKYTAIKQRMEASGINGVFIEHLSDMEQKLVGIVTIDSFDGDGNTSELGVPSGPIPSVPSPMIYEESLPSPPSCSSTPISINEQSSDSFGVPARLETSGTSGNQARPAASSSKKSNVDEEMQLLQRMVDMDKKRLDLDVQRNKREQEAEERSSKEHSMKMELYRTKLKVLEQQIRD